MNLIAATYDCLAVGGGPAGLTAALYLARFRRRVLVIDAGKSRAASIPKSHNYPGVADGISGDVLLRTLRTQAEDYGAKERKIEDGDVEATTSPANGIDVAWQVVRQGKRRRLPNRAAEAVAATAINSLPLSFSLGRQQRSRLAWEPIG